jgi:proteic killer suppression protein
MKIEFEKDYLRELYENGKTTDKKHRFQPQIVRKFVICVKTLEDAVKIEDLFPYNALHYEKLKGDKQGLSSIRINDQYRIEFRELVNPNNILEIEICSIVDITNHYK